jgi:hypothetical protein
VAAATPERTELREQIEHSSAPSLPVRLRDVDDAMKLAHAFLNLADK